MFRIDNPSSVTLVPATQAPGTPGYFSEGDVTVGQEATIVTADFMNSVQEEICNAITGSGLTLDKMDRTQLWQALQRIGRIKLRANATFYVSTSGSDFTGDGLTPGTAWRTPQHAWNAINAYVDANGYFITISIGPGSYGNFQTNQSIVPNCPTVTFQGDEETPGNVVFNGATGYPAALCTSPTLVFFRGIRFKGMMTMGSGYEGCGLASVDLGNVYVDKCDFAACAAYQMVADDRGALSAYNGSYTISGGALVHVAAAANGILSINACSLVISGTPNYSRAFAEAVRCGVVQFWITSAVTGAATGVRYHATLNGVVDTETGGNVNALPGNAAGILELGGQYN